MSHIIHLTLNIYRCYFSTDFFKKIQTLLVFPEPQSSPLASLLDPSRRQKIARDVNAAILSSFHQQNEPRLPMLFKMLVWAQNKLDENVVYPRCDEFSTSSATEQQQQQVLCHPRLSFKFNLCVENTSKNLWKTLSHTIFCTICHLKITMTQMWFRFFDKYEEYRCILIYIHNITCGDRIQHRISSECCKTSNYCPIIGYYIQKITVAIFGRFLFCGYFLRLK